VYANVLQHVTAVPILKAATSGSIVSFMSFRMPNILNAMYLQQLRVVIFPLYIYIYIYIYTGCPRRNVPDFGRMFLKLKYTDLTKKPISEVKRLRR